MLTSKRDQPNRQTFQSLLGHSNPSRKPGNEPNHSPAQKGWPPCGRQLSTYCPGRRIGQSLHQSNHI